MAHACRWPNGAIASIYNATEPDQLRGPSHDAAWCDELAKWRYCQETWDNLEFGLRAGEHPRIVVTTTPKPIRTLKEIIADAGTVVTRGSTYENIGNLSPKFIDRVVRRYEGTRLGRQELGAEMLEDVVGALWLRSRIDELRIKPEAVPPLRRIVIAIDPAVTSGEDAGRGFGKTRSGAEWVRAQVCGSTPLGRGRCRHVALVAETAADARDVMVGDGHNDAAAGLLETSRNDPRFVRARLCARRCLRSIYAERLGA
jgi:phage terminase large subunit-like protein